MVDGSRYSELSARYLADAEALLAKGDCPQASEKFWGAVAQAAKAAAAARRWRHSTHRDLRRTVFRLFSETGDREVLDLFAIAEALHANFYEDYLEEPVVRAYSQSVRRLAEMLGRYRDGEYTNG